MDDLLTTRQLQDLLQVDRITIYRMLADGRLNGFKVGGQWRFSRREIEAWLDARQSGLEGAGRDQPSPASDAHSAQALPLACVQLIQDLCAEAMDIAAVTVEPGGRPLTAVSNSCAYCSLILATAEGRRRCAASWRVAGGGQVRPCHAGLLCVAAAVEAGGQTVAVTAGCQFSAQPAEGVTPEWRRRLPQVAASLGLEPGELEAAAGSVRMVPQDDLSRVARLVERVAGAFSEMGEERLDLLRRLESIAEMSRI
jgi:excisionase family DNA binding protein